MPNHFRQRFSFNKQIDLAGIEHLPDQQSFRDARQGVTVSGHDVLGLQVRCVHKVLHFLVDLDGGVLAEITRGRKVTPQEEIGRASCRERVSNCV